MLRSNRLDATRDAITWLGLTPSLAIVSGAALAAVLRNVRVAVIGLSIALLAVASVVASWERTRWHDQANRAVGVVFDVNIPSVPPSARTLTIRLDAGLALSMVLMIGLFLIACYMDTSTYRDTIGIVSAIAAYGAVLFGPTIAGVPASSRYWLAAWSVVATTAVAAMHGHSNGRRGWWTWQFLADTALLVTAWAGADSPPSDRLDRVWVVAVLWKMLRPCMVTPAGATGSIARILLPLLWAPSLLDPRVARAVQSVELEWYSLALLSAILTVAALARSTAMAIPMRLSGLCGWQLAFLVFPDSVPKELVWLFVAIALFGLSLLNLDPRPDRLRPGIWRCAGEFLLAGFPFIGIGWPLAVYFSNFASQSSEISFRQFANPQIGLALLLCWALQACWLGRTIASVVRRQPTFYPAGATWVLWLPAALGFAAIPLLYLATNIRDWNGIQSKPLSFALLPLLATIVGVTTGYFLQLYEIRIADLNPGPRARRSINQVRSWIMSSSHRASTKSQWEIVQVLVMAKRESNALAVPSRIFIAVVFVVVTSGVTWWMHGR